MVTRSEQHVEYAISRRAAAQQPIYDEVRDAAADAERQQLGRDLHDTVVQTLYAANLLAETLCRGGKQTPDQARRDLDELRQLTRRALAETRALVSDRRPSLFSDQSIAEAFEDLAALFTKRTQIPVTLKVEGSYIPPPNLQDALSQIAREALNNIAKHAAANQVWLALLCTPQGCKLTIRDDGCGFERRQVATGCFGLDIMQERAVCVGARFSIASQPGGGTTVTITWSAANPADASV